MNTHFPLINVEVGINVEGGIFWEKTRSGGWKKSKKSINVKRVDFFGRGWNFSKLVSVTSRLLER